MDQLWKQANLNFTVIFPFRFLSFFIFFFYICIFNRNAERVDLCDKSGAARGG